MNNVDRIDFTEQWDYIFISCTDKVHKVDLQKKEKYTKKHNYNWKTVSTNEHN